MNTETDLQNKRQIHNQLWSETKDFDKEENVNWYLVDNIIQLLILSLKRT